jgi:hypothetical protein
MSDVPIPVAQLLMIFLFVRKNRTCRDGWTNAGFTRRAATLAWASGNLVGNGTLAEKQGLVGITSRDVFPQGVDAIDRSDVERFHGQLAEWLEYWSERHPSDTLQQAMLNLLGRLFKIKAAWVEERTDPFSFGLAMEKVRTPQMEELMGGAKV